VTDAVAALAALLQPPGLAQTLYPATSRYAGLPTSTLQTASGQTVAYLTRRFLPDPAILSTLQVHTVTQGERLDNIAYACIGDPLQFWQICDANRAMHPDDLTAVVGRRLRITLPAGLSGGTSA
jgi:hypothetical protein